MGYIFEWMDLIGYVFIECGIRVGDFWIYVYGSDDLFIIICINCVN